MVVVKVAEVEVEVEVEAKAVEVEALVESGVHCCCALPLMFTLDSLEELETPYQ